jgi:hypothetical protein
VDKLIAGKCWFSEKTKYIPVTTKSHAIYPHYLNAGLYKFQIVYSFTYLRSDVNCNNDIGVEIQKLILVATRCFYGLRKHMSFHLASKRNAKILKYKVLIRPVLTYASEIWTLSETNERRLSLFEIKAHRCIFGAKKENETGRKRYNYELYETFNASNVVSYIKVKRLSWAGHLMCANNDRALKKYI